MTLIKQMRWLFIFLAVLNNALIASNSDVLTAQQMAESFQYKGKLDSFDDVAKNLKAEGKFLWGRSYHSQDGVVGYIMIFYQSHSYLNSNFFSRFTKADKGLHEFFLKSESNKLNKISQTTNLQEQQEMRIEYEAWRKQELKNDSVKTLKLKNGSTAYFHPMFGGPGGGGFIVDVDDYLGRFDLLLITFIGNYMDDVAPGDTNVVRVLPETKEYLKRFDEFGDGYNLLQSGVETLYPAIEAQYQKITSETNQTNLSTRPRQNENQHKPESTQSDEKEKQTLNWSLIGIFILGLIIVLLGFYYWQKSSK